MEIIIEYLKKLIRSHSLVHSKEKIFFYDKISLIFSISLAIILYTLIIDNEFPLLKTIGYLSMFTLFVIPILDFILFPFFIKNIFGYGIDGVWEGEFIMQEPIPASLKIQKFEILDFGKKCLITVETDSFISNSIVAKIILKDENRVDLKFIYDVNYKNIDKDDHYGMTEITFYKNGSPPKGEYYTRDNGILRYGKINLNRKIK